MFPDCSGVLRPVAGVPASARVLVVLGILAVSFFNFVVVSTQAVIPTISDILAVAGVRTFTVFPAAVCFPFVAGSFYCWSSDDSVSADPTVPAVAGTLL